MEGTREEATPSGSEETIAGDEEILGFSGRGILDEGSKSLLGVLVEIGTRGILRYKWDHAKPLVKSLLEARLLEFEQKSTAGAEMGRSIWHRSLSRESSPFLSPSPSSSPQPSKENDNPITHERKPTEKDRMLGLLAQFSDYPFTIQRICEMLVIPDVYYTKFDQLIWALEKCLMVTETVKQTQGLSATGLPTLRELEAEVAELRKPPPSPQPDPSLAPAPATEERDAPSPQPAPSPGLPPQVPPESAPADAPTPETPLAEADSNSAAAAVLVGPPVPPPIVYTTKADAEVEALAETRSDRIDVREAPGTPYVDADVIYDANGNHNAAAIQGHPMDLVTPDPADLKRNGETPAYLDAAAGNNNNIMLESPQKKHKIDTVSE